MRSTATVRRLQRRDKTKKHTEQAQRISDAWDQRDFRTLWSTLWTETKAMRHLLELSADSRRMGDTSQTSWTVGRCSGTKVEWEAQLLEARVREQQGVRWAAAEGYSAEPEELEADFRGTVRRLRQSPLRRATPGWAAPGELWRQVVDPMRDNTRRNMR